jgi:hypothetical protein
VSLLREFCIIAKLFRGLGPASGELLKGLLAGLPPPLIVIAAKVTTMPVVSIVTSPAAAQASYENPGEHEQPDALQVSDRMRARRVGQYCIPQQHDEISDSECEEACHAHSK